MPESQLSRVYCPFEGHNVFLSSSHPGIPGGIPAYLGLTLGIPKGVMELLPCALKQLVSAVGQYRSTVRTARDSEPAPTLRQNTLARSDRLALAAG